MPPLQNFLRLFKWLNTRYAGHPFRLTLEISKLGFAVHIFTEFFYTVTPAGGPSMLPTFEILGDSLLTSKKYRRGRGIEVGDLVTFDSVVEPGERVVKRVLGLEGDYVMRDSPESSGNQIIQVSEAFSRQMLMVSHVYQVPQGHCWLVGDNLPYSRDSRLFGPVPMALIKGKIIAKVFPWRERRWIINGVCPVEGS
jgi:inner membrane protease subunit 1